MSEAVKKPRKSPESYRPKTPEIVNMAAIAVKPTEADKCDVVASNGGSYIDGIPVLKWGVGKDSSYCGCMTAALNAMGYNISYEDVMGLSGVCFQAIMRSDWDPSSEMPQNGLLCEENVCNALGIGLYSIGDEAEIHRQTQSCLDDGIPVLMVGGRDEPEWTIACGYVTDNGRPKYFGRSYFDSQNEARIDNNEKFTANGYYIFDSFPGLYPEALTKFFNRLCEPIPLKQALKVSLETCIKTFGQPSGEYHNFGYAAYDVLINGFALDENEYKSRCRCDKFHIGCMQDARRAAYIYLERSAELLSGENRENLLEVSSLYKQMYENLTEVVPYEKTTAVFNVFANAVWSEDVRQALIAALKANKELEKQARAMIANILDRWETDK